MIQDILGREFPNVLVLGGATAGVVEHLQEMSGTQRIVQMDSSRTGTPPLEYLMVVLFSFLITLHGGDSAWRRSVPLSG